MSGREVPMEEQRELLKEMSRLTRLSRAMTDCYVFSGRVCSKRIFEEWRLLNRIVLRHESTIQKKWLKKLREQRRITLLHACAEMPKKHRPDIEVFLANKPDKPGKYLANPVYLWPDLNQEDLLKPKNLLIFLNARARHYPSVFAGADEQSFKFGLTTGKVEPTFVSDHTMMFTGHNSPDSYGQIYDWEEHDDAIDWFMSGRGVQPGLGFVVQHVQDRVYQFLVDCCLHILQMTREAALADNIPIEPTPPPISVIEGPVYSLSDIAAVAPYSVPAKLDLGFLRELIAARRAAAEDHFWSLREDPGYFESAILEVKDHRRETLLDINGRPHSLYSPPWIANEFWRRVVTKVCLEASGLLDVWHFLLTQIDGLISLLKKYEGRLREELPLPQELMNAFLDLEFSLGIYMNVPLHILDSGVVASPPMRSRYARTPEINPLLIDQVVLKPNATKDPTQDKLMFLFDLLGDKKYREEIGAHPILDMIERLVQEDPKSRTLFTNRIADAVADYSLLGECQRHIRLFQPWASTFEQSGYERKDICQADYVKRTRRMVDVEKAFGPIPTNLFQPSDKKFYYPADKKRTKETTLAMQAAENYLAVFWAMVDQTLLKTVNSSKYGAWTCLLSPNRKVQRTPDWVEPASVVLPEDEGKETTLVEELMQGLELRSESTIDNEESKQQQKDKIKTRGIADATAEKTVDQESTMETEASSLTDQHPIFKVDKRALKVFSTLFYQPSVSSQPGEIPWNDFLHAMKEAGFTAAKMYGSVWHFAPLDSGLAKSIQFHEPHPSSKIPFNTARRFGRRLFRNYGWRGDMFVLADSKV